MVSLSSILAERLFGVSLEKKVAFEKAARKIQSAVRIFQAREQTRKLIRLRFIKLYDNVNDDYVYKDRVTQYIHLSKPALLGSKDLPTPAAVIAPDDYDPGYDAVYKDGHAIIVTVSSFTYNDMIPDLPAGTIAEHDVLKEVLSHDFICKFLPDNVTSLFNPTCEQFTEAFSHLQKVCKRDDYLLVYVCSHIGTAYKGEKKGNENGYILMYDTKWSTPKEIAESSISVATMGRYLNKILCKEKTILLNCAHQDRPPSRFFASKVLYPPRNVYSRLADICNCVVIGSCAVGALISDVISHTVLPRQSVGKQAVKSFSDLLMGSKVTPKVTESTTKTTASNLSNEDITVANDSEKQIDQKNNASILHRIRSIAQTIKTKIPGSNRKHSHYSLNSNIGTLPGSIGGSKGLGSGEGGKDGGKIIRKKRKVPESVQFVTELSSAQALEIFNKNIADWKVKLKADLKPSVHPEGPKLEWSKVDSKEKGMDFKFDLPTDRDFTMFKIRHLQWRVNRTLGPPSNFLRQRYRRVEDRRRTAPSEVGLLDQTGTLFGSALIAALKGGASSSQLLVTAESLFTSISLNIKTALKAPTTAHKYDTTAFQRSLLSPEALMLADKKVLKNLKKAEKAKKAKKIARKKKNEKAYLKALKNARKRGLKAPKRITGGDEEEAVAVGLNQSPVMTVPRVPRFGVKSGGGGGAGILKAIPVTQSNSHSVLHTVFVSCSPPPAPCKPSIVSVGQTDVALRWEDPPFSGVSTTAYRIFFRNESRNFHDWQLLPNVGPIKTSHYHIRNLTRGVECQFRVKAYNNGGWGSESLPSDEVCPGAGYTTISTAVRRSRLSMGGPLAILDRLELLPVTRDEHLWGLSRLRSMVQIASGYKRGNVQVKVALAAVHGLKTFPSDPEMIGAALSLLGWALVGPATEGVLRILKENKVTELSIEYMSKYRINCDVIGAITWLRCNMPVGSIPQPPIVIHKVPVLAIVKKDELVDTDEEDNEAKEQKEGL